jgi:diguanylate cyclase (GGDEF)-like protein
MKNAKSSPGKASEECLARLEQDRLRALQALESAATLGLGDTAGRLATQAAILRETAARVKAVLPLKAFAFFLVREPGGEFFPARCHPTSRMNGMQDALARLVERGEAAAALRTGRPVFAPDGPDGKTCILHSIATASRIRGLFLGFSASAQRTIPDAAVTLVTILMRGCASLLESREIYALWRAANAQLKARVMELERSQRALKREIERRGKVEKALKHQALHDALTGLPNRVLARDRIQQAAHRAQRRDGHGYAVAFLDLDHFKPVNDTLGHEAGDELLIRAGERISESVRQLDTVARFGGDEFVVLLDDLESPAEAVRILNRVLKDLARPFGLAAGVVRVTASIGLAFGPASRGGPDALIKNASTAMHMAKEAGRNRIKVFRTGMRGMAGMNAGLISRLGLAVREGKISVLLTPALSAHDLRPRGFEAVPVWRPKGRAAFQGDELMELAAKAGVAQALWLATLEQTLECLRSIRAEAAGIFTPVASLTLRAPHLPGLDLDASVAARLERAGLAPEHLRVEVTENALAKGGEGLAVELNKLMKRGVSIRAGMFGEPLVTLLSDPRLARTRSRKAGPHAALARTREMAEHLESLALARDLSTPLAGSSGPSLTWECLKLLGESLGRPLTCAEALEFVRKLGRCLRGES